MSVWNKEKYKLGDYQLIPYQILQTNITGIVWKTSRKITCEILRVKGLKNELQFILQHFKSLSLKKGIII